MKRSVLASVCCVAIYPFSSFVFADDEVSPSEASPSLRNICHARYFYSLAVSTTDHSKRIDWLDKAIEADPEFAAAFFRRGNAKMDLSKLDEARKDFESSVRLWPELILAHYNLACSYSLLGDAAAAKEELEKAINLGYDKLDRLANDPDLEVLRENGTLSKLIESVPRDRKVSIVAKFQQASVTERLTILALAVGGTHKDQLFELAEFGFVDVDPRARVLSLQLWHKLDARNTQGQLLRALYDNDPRVGAAATDLLASYGDDAEPFAAWALDDSQPHVLAFALDILAHVGSQRYADEAARLLKHDRWPVRTAAARAIAKLGATKFNDEIEAAAKIVPNEKAARAKYAEVFSTSLEHLRSLENQ